MPQIYTFLSKVAEALASQLFDLRSTITKEACKTISLIAEVLQSEFDLQAGNVFVTDISLFKLMESGNHMMAEHAHMCVVSILNNTLSVKVLRNILKQTTDKHTYIRMNCAEYVLTILMRYPQNVLDKF